MLSAPVEGLVRFGMLKLPQNRLAFWARYKVLNSIGILLAPVEGFWGSGMSELTQNVLGCCGFRAGSSVVWVRVQLARSGICQVREVSNLVAHQVEDCFGTLPPQNCEPCTVSELCRQGRFADY